ncbi:MAG: hypothetical protein V1907_02355 [Candidatus Kerfeldbacteria bacterium]
MFARFRRYLITAAALFVAATLFSMWRESCTPKCAVDTVVFGFPVFLRTPFSPYSPGGPVFEVVPFVVNVLWTIGVSVCFWTVVETLGRWRERGRQPPFV